MKPEFVPLTREVFRTLRADDLVFYRSPGRMGYTDLYQFCMSNGKLYFVCDGFDDEETEVSTQEFEDWVKPLTFQMLRFRLFRGFGAAIYVRQSRLSLNSIKKHLLSHLRWEFFVRSYSGNQHTYIELVQAVTVELKSAADS